LTTECDVPDSHPSRYEPRATLLNFSDLWETGAFNVLSPLVVHPKMQEVPGSIMDTLVLGSMVSAGVDSPGSMVLVVDAPPCGLI
jgi:hypothetical protein